MTVGVLAFQGDVAEHKGVIESLGHTMKEVRTAKDLEGLSHLVLPGGESTVMEKFLHMSGLDKTIIKKARAGELALFGTCAGCILLARKAVGKNAPRTLGLLDITVDRNAYGTQLNSFEATLQVKGVKHAVPVAFIRAPRIMRTGKATEILASMGEQPVLVREGRIMAATCHPEARNEVSIHRLFLSL